jgi:predicted CXXCH cytochrome family protein
MLVEWLLIISLLLGAGILMFRKVGFARSRLAGCGFFTTALLGVWLWQNHLEKKLDSQTALTIPRVGRPDEYVGSASCRSCHPDQYSSWHRSYHRTMTQVASPDSVRGNFDGVNLTLDGDIYRLQRRGDEFWVEMVDPDWKLNHESTPQLTSPGSASNSATFHLSGPRVERRISMVTGSHRMQAYWVENGHGNQQFSLPFTFLFEQERWVPRRCVFLKDPSALSWKQVWNVGCIDCHSTAGQPWRQEDEVSFDTRVAEFGIACEACHGPAGEHVRRNSNPLRRYALHLAGKGDPTIVNPSRLNSKRSSEVCGRCHSVHATRDDKEWFLRGESFHPGDDLEAKLNIIRRQQSAERRRGTFWSDGMVRISGREYNGLIKSPCFIKGEMSCSSCHSMHESSPTNQVAKGMEGNAACLQCHQSFAKDLTQHTHHAAGSTGSLCYNCHMPYTSYGLLKGIRSHQVSNPSVHATLRTGRPNACNLCHLDKTLEWTGQTLTTWYKTPTEELTDEDKTVAASILWALKGDAGQRALIAWHMGWKPAQEASHLSWLAPYLATLLEDPYPVVRYIAARSLKELPGFETFSYDYVATGARDLRASHERALGIWERTAKPEGNPSLLLERNGVLDRDALEALLKNRNNRTLELFE